MTAAIGSPRLYGVASSALVGGYALMLFLDGIGGAPGFQSLEPFPLGGAAGPGSTGLRVAALILGLTLGWGVPGLPLARLTEPRLGGSALLARAFGLGIGYILVTGLAYAAVAGHAPPRAALLVLVAVPGLVLALMPPVHAGNEQPARGHTPAAALIAMVLLTAVLWPKLHHEGMNGDGTEAYELSRSLEAHRLPRWEIEGADPPGRFGTPITVPFFTGAYVVFAEMMVLGRGELAVRLPIVPAFVVLAITTIGLLGRRDRWDWPYIAGLGVVYLLWNAYYVGYEPPFDIAEPAGTDTLTIALWLVGLREVVRGAVPLGVAFLVLASATTWSAPLLSVLAAGFLWVLDRDRGRQLLRWGTLALAVVLPALALVAWTSDLWAEWARQFRFEYWDDLVDPGRRVPSLPLFGQLVLMTGVLPFMVPFVWRRSSTAGRLLFLTGVAYLAIVLAASNKSLHYLMPLPWIFLVPAVEASGNAKRLRVGAALMLAVVVVLSWPSGRDVRRETVFLGQESCVAGFGYEAAALAAGPLYDALAPPPSGDRFAVGKHTFVRYAMDLGGTDCVIGLSPDAPSGAIVLADGPSSVVWTTDVNRFAHWRLHRMTRPSSVLFPREDGIAYPLEAGEWAGRLDLATEPARALRLSHIGDDAGGAGGLPERVRVLVPVPAGGTNEVRIGFRSLVALSVTATVNGVPAGEVVVVAGTSEIGIHEQWRPGWNVLELAAAGGMRLSWIELRR